MFFIFQMYRSEIRPYPLFVDNNSISGKTGGFQDKDVLNLSDAASANNPVFVAAP
jgi:hypothetical protein